MATNTGTLQVIVHKAKGLPATSAVGAQDPYCKMRLDTSKKWMKSRTHQKGGVAPVWEQTFDVGKLTGEERFLQFGVWTENTLRDSNIASADMHLRKVCEIKGNVWWPLTEPGSDAGKPCGDFLITVKYTPSAEELAELADSEDEADIAPAAAADDAKEEKKQ